MNTVRMKILVDNRPGEGLAAEHGLSMWIEADGLGVLFDTGQGPALANNAPLLGIGPSSADHVVLSHGHFDHTGLLHEVLAGGGARLWRHGDALLERFSVRRGAAREIGMPAPAVKSVLALAPDRVIDVVEPVMISASVGVTGPVPRKTNCEDTGGPFFLDPQGVKPDPILDDMSLWIRTGDGIVLCTGCCHSGLVNTLLHADEITGGGRLRAVVGGLHLFSAGAERMRRTLDELDARAPDMIVPCHCTGENAVQALEQRFGSRVAAGRSGMIIEF